MAQVTALIQARMSSARFPGKVLAPFRGRPMISHVVEAVSRARGIDQVIVATSVDASDDPLAVFVASLGVRVFRGSLDDVFSRFRECLETYPSDWLLRVSADSPLLDSAVLDLVVGHRDRDRADIVTTIHPRTLPKGQNAELIRVDALKWIDPALLSSHDREHVTPFFYRSPERFRIVSVRGEPPLDHLDCAVDTIDDLKRLEAMDEIGPATDWLARTALT